MTDVDEKWIMQQQMIEIQATKAFKKISVSVDDLVSVDSIISKEEQIKHKKEKTRALNANLRVLIYKALTNHSADIPNA